MTARRTEAATFDVVYAPLGAHVAANEGLMVLLCDLAKSLNKAGIAVRIHTTDRHLPSLERILDHHGVDEQTASIEVHGVGSYGLAREQAASTKRGPRGTGSFSRKLMLAVGLRLVLLMRRAVVWILDGTRFTSLVRMAVVLPAAIVIALVAVPLVFLVGLLASLAGTKRALRWGVRKLRQLARWIGIPSPVRRAYRLMKRARQMATTNLYVELYRGEQRRLAESLNRNASVRALFFYSAFDGGIVSRLDKPCLVVFPDAVTGLFPTRYLNDAITDQLIQMKQAVKHAAAIVCYSEYVADGQLRRYFQDEVGEKKVHVIPQGYFAANVSVDQSETGEVADRLNLERSRRVNLFPSLLLGPPQAKFGTFRYLLYPTIDRPHKNTVTLLRALSSLVRQNFMNLKVVLTTAAATRDVHELIHGERLQYDVIFMPSVPGHVLDLLFRGAALTVHPSLSEGGDIFNFSRAVSNGCPAIVSDAKMCHEMFSRGGIPEEQYRKWLFNPVDHTSLATRIRTSLASRSALLADQRNALQSLQQYSYEAMASRYWATYSELLNE